MDFVSLSPLNGPFKVLALPFTRFWVGSSLVSRHEWQPTIEMNKSLLNNNLRVLYVCVAYKCLETGLPPTGERSKKDSANLAKIPSCLKRFRRCVSGWHSCWTVPAN
ncbi:hypothetical protein XENOCAPTIV_006598 [Xenoophorus captivus]|uniref:Uncharacterized protein n=1 Tax=Xenoophorus captivus TaxID=1517983 RepID=A0ABV0S5J8_9TELE